MIPVTLDALQDYLENKKLSAQKQAETNQVYIVFKYGGKEFPLFIRIFEGGELLQLLAFIPCTLKASSVNDVARLLHYLNKELDIPGFCLDETSSLIFYRVMIPVIDNQISEDVFNSYLNSIQTICQTFAPVASAVAGGITTFSEVLKKVKENQAKQNK